MSRPARSARFVLTLLLAAAGGASTVRVQQAAPPAPPPASAQQPQQPTFRAEANYVRVDVYPTTDGQPVLDLKQQEFEVFEDGVSQKIAAFEHIVVRPAGPQETRVEPNTAEQGNRLAGDARNRVFVLFFDTYFTKQAPSRQVGRPMAELLEKAIGQDDLVGAMTPEMSAREVTLARRTVGLQAILNREWWGRRDRITNLDPEEESYRACFEKVYESAQQTASAKALAQELIQRRREKRVLDALQDLVRHLHGLREERKAILVISEGWQLYRPNLELARTINPGSDQVPGVPPIVVGPTGKLGTKDPRQTIGGFSAYECDRDRMNLAQLDNDQQFRDMIGEANRANASFYTIDPRGLPAWDSDMGPEAPPPPAVDFAILRNRQTNLRTLAEATDGMAVMNSNDISAGLKRVVADLTSYYLLGYYSTNAKADGKFRTIKVRVKRPGVEVRARRGYRAPTKEELTAGATAGAAKAAAAGPPSHVESALSRLAGVRPEARFRVAAVPLYAEGAGGRARSLWIVGELDPEALRGAEWKQGGDAELTVTAGPGQTLATTRVEVAPGARGFLSEVPLSAEAKSGDLRVTVLLRPAGGGLPMRDVITVRATADGHERLPLMFRRGPSTGLAYVATADLRFRRSERVRAQVPLSFTLERASARLLDRRGQPLELPVTTIERDERGSRWLEAEVALAPLAPGQYVVELVLVHAGATERLSAPVEVIR